MDFQLCVGVVTNAPHTFTFASSLIIKFPRKPGGNQQSTSSQTVVGTDLPFPYIRPSNSFCHSLFSPCHSREIGNPSSTFDIILPVVILNLFQDLITKSCSPPYHSFLSLSKLFFTLINKPGRTDIPLCQALFQNTALAGLPPSLSFRA